MAPEQSKPIRTIDGLGSLEDLSDVLTLLGNLTRLRVIAALAEGPMFVQELSSKLGVSYPLLHLHLKNMERHGIVKSEYKVGSDKATRYVRRYFELVDFDIRVTPKLIADLGRQDGGQKKKRRKKQSR